jgi:ubiquitin-like 1-activating enzyme E1 A
MNPFITVSSVNIPLTAEHLKQYNIVLLFRGTLQDITSVEAACMSVNVPFFTACCNGIYGWAFANLHKYSYDIEKKQESKDGSSITRTVTSYTIEYPTWDAAMRGGEGGGGGGMKVRKISKVYIILRISMEFEKRNGRCPTESDADIEEVKGIMKEQGLPDGAVDEAALALYCAQSGGEEMPAVNAVVGGILANAVLGAVSKNVEPLNNLFCFSLLDGMGMVETVGHGSV